MRDSNEYILALMWYFYPKTKFNPEYIAAVAQPESIGIAFLCFITKNVVTYQRYKVRNLCCAKGILNKFRGG